MARSLGIVIIFLDLGDTYGFYRCYKRVKTIVINSELSEWLKRYVCAHELGHAILHSDLNTSFLKKNTFYSIGKIEREANEFAVNLLLYDKNLEDYGTKFDILRENGIPYEMERFM
ncbi:ImmA/IrrE family metallo-endopeptidase [Caldifermentibacillus hisashii]|uniref:ImmA/IrrE family metallo-endopeptidase n=1 Tax=Caldifermentibacillus hisashii TaxID=996558 RepID=UPI0031011674|nr:ImmA/IrrE family metallo-endopeptidase [Caldibacillus thermoamylovorans]